MLVFNMKSLKLYFKKSKKWYNKNLKKEKDFKGPSHNVTENWSVKPPKDGEKTCYIIQ